MTTKAILFLTLLTTPGYNWAAVLVKVLVMANGGLSSSRLTYKPTEEAG